MVSLGQHLDDRQKQGSVIHPASVVKNRADGDVDVMIRLTQKTVRASRGNTGGTFTPGQVVQVSRTDASGVTSNTGWVIIGSAPSSMRGSSKSSRLSDTTRRSAAVITRIVPNPVLITAGEVVTVTLYGAFPDGTVVTYGSGDLSNDSAPVVTASQITLRVRAAGGASEKYADLLIDGVVAAPELFHLVPVHYPLHSIWALVYNDDYATQALVRIDASNMTLFHQYDLGGFVGLTYITNKSGTIYAKCGTQFLKFNAATGAMLTPAACTNSSDELQLADAGNFIFYGDFLDSPDHLYVFDVSSDTEGGWALALSGGPLTPGQTALDFDGLHMWLCGGPLVRWATASSSVVGEFAVAAQAIAIDEGAIFVSVGSDIRKYDSTPVNPTTLTLLTSATMAAGGAVGAQNKMKIVGGHLYATINGSNRLTRFDQSTLAVLAEVNIGHTPTEFELADGIFYVGDLDGGITRIDAATMTVIDRTTFATNDVGALLYL